MFFFSLKRKANIDALKSSGISPILIDFFSKNLATEFLKKEHFQEIIDKKLINATSIKAITEIKKTHEFEPLSLLQLVILDHFYNNDYEAFSKEPSWQSPALNALKEEDQFNIAEKLIAGKEFIKKFTEQDPSPTRGDSDLDLFRYESIAVGFSDLNFNHPGHKAALLLTLPQSEGYFAENLILEFSGKTISEKVFAILTVSQINPTAATPENENIEEGEIDKPRETQTISERRNKDEWQKFKKDQSTNLFMFKYHASKEVMAEDYGISIAEVEKNLFLAYNNESSFQPNIFKVKRYKSLIWELLKTKFDYKQAIENPDIWQHVQPVGRFKDSKPVYEKIIKKYIFKKLPKEIAHQFINQLQERLEDKNIIPGVSYLNFISAWIEAHEGNDRKETARKLISQKLNINENEYHQATQKALFQELLMLNPNAQPTKPFVLLLESEIQESEDEVEEIDAPTENSNQNGNPSSNTSQEQDHSKEGTQWTFFKLFINELINTIGLSEDINYFDEARKALTPFIERHGLEQKDIRINTRHIGGMLYNLGFTLRDLINNHFDYDKAYDDFAKRPKTYQLAPGKSKRSALREIFGKSGLGVDYLDNLEKSFMRPVTYYLPDLIVNAYATVCASLKEIKTSQWLDALTSHERDEAKISAALGIQIPTEVFQELIINADLSQLVKVFPKQTNKVLKALKENHASSSLVAKILFPELSLSDAQIEINKVIFGNDKLKKQFELLLDKEIENINKLLRIDIDLSLSIDQQHALILHRLALVYGLRPALPQEYYTPQLIKDIRSYQTDEDPFDFDGALLGSLLYFIKDIEIENQKVTARNLSIQINQWLKENQLTLSETMINQLIHNANLSEKIHLEELKIESAAEKPLLAAAEFDANTQKKEFLKRIMSKYEWSAHKAMQDERLAHINDANHLLEVLLEEGLMSVYEKNIKEKAKKIIGECKEDFKLLINYLKYEKSYIKELGISEQLAQLVEDRLLDLSSFLSGTHETLKVTDKKTVDEQKLKHLPTAYYNDHQKDLNSLLLVEFFDIEIVDAIWVYTHYYLSLNFVDVRSYKGLKEINDYLIKTSKKIDHRWNAVAQLNEEDMLNGWPFEILEGKKINGLAPAKAKILSEGEWQEILTEHPLLVETLRLQIENWAQDYLKKDVPEIIRQLASADNRLLNHFKTYFPHYHDLRAKLIEFANKEFNGMSADMIEKRFKISKAQFSWFTNQIKY